MDIAGTPPLVAALVAVFLVGALAAGQPDPGRERSGPSAGPVTLGVVAAALVAIYLVAR